MTDDLLELLTDKNRSHISALADNCFLIFDFCQRPPASADGFADINSAGYTVYFKQSSRSIAQLQNSHQRLRGSRRAADGWCGFPRSRCRRRLPCWCRFGFASQNLRLGSLRLGRGNGDGTSIPGRSDRPT
jgi:hypothetical protein